MTALFELRASYAPTRGRGGVTNVGVLFPRCLVLIEPLTSLSPLSLALFDEPTFVVHFGA